MFNRFRSRRLIFTLLACFFAAITWADVFATAHAHRHDRATLINLLVDAALTTLCAIAAIRG